MGNNNLRIIIVGYGIQGKKRHKYAKNIFAIVDPIAPEADFKTLEEVPLDRFDAALVCTGDEEKFNLISYLINRKKHVLVEKPLFFKNKEIYIEFEKLCKKNNVYLYSAYNHRFEPHFIKMKKCLSSNKLGKIYNIRIFYGNGTAQLVKDSSWRDKNSGVLGDLGSHVFDTLDFWFKDIKSHSFNLTRSSCNETNAFDYVFINSKDKNKPFIQIELSMLSWRNTFNCDIYGSLGSAHIDSLCKWGPSKFIYRKRVFPSGIPLEDNQTIIQEDPTWNLEFENFTQMCLKNSKKDLTKDIWIYEKLNDLSKQANLIKLI